MTTHTILATLTVSKWPLIVNGDHTQQNQVDFLEEGLKQSTNRLVCLHGWYLDPKSLWGMEFFKCWRSQTYPSSVMTVKLAEEFHKWSCALWTIKPSKLELPEVLTSANPQNTPTSFISNALFQKCLRLYPLMYTNTLLDWKWNPHLQFLCWRRWHEGTCPKNSNADFLFF